MIHSNRFTVVLDTNVLFPFEIRDVLFWFAVYELYTPRWSKDIMNELASALLRHGLSEEKVARLISKTAAVFPDAIVDGYEPIIETLNLPDFDDRHVLASAIHCKADQIVTNNLKDFPTDYIGNFDISVLSADDFLADTIDLNPKLATRAFKELVRNRKNPDQDIFQVLAAMRRNSLKKSADFLHSQIP